MKILKKYAVIVILFSLVSLFSACKEEEIIINVVPPSVGRTLTLSGISTTESGVNARNSVFVDMSKDLQSSVLRTSWDLGFYCGSEFRVILNHSTGATAIQLDKTNLSDVNLDDVAALPEDSVSLDLGKSLAMVDPVSGNFTSYLGGTVWKEVALTENKVFILKRGIAGNIPRRDLMKVLVTRINNGYRVQYGTVDGTFIRTAEVLKDASYNFKFISFDGLATLAIEPAKKLWDIQYSVSTYQLAGVPVAEPDFILINFANGVTAAEVVYGTDDTRNYANFTKEMLSGITFSGDRDAIGVKWRTTVGSTPSTLNIRTDRFYLVKDTEGNIYKLKFNGGLRGRPEIEYRRIEPVVEEI
jgi:hypothetical protein